MVELPSLTFCPVPWMHLELQGDGSVVFCRTHGNKRIGQLTNTAPLDELKTIWNSEDQISIRSRMLSGACVPECGKCFRNERFGSFSTRTLANKIYTERIRPSVLKTKSSGECPDFAPLYLSLKTSTHCNCRCRTCGPWNSSGWLRDYKAMTGLSYKNPALNENRILQTLEALVSRLELLYFVGGEPLLSELHYRALDLVLAQGRNDLHLSYSTNLTTLKLKHWSVLDYWKNFERVTLSISVDAIGARNDYLRKGSDWHTLLENRELLRKHAPHVKILVHPTISVFNVATLPQYVEWMLKHQFVDDPSGSFIFNRLEEPEHLSIQVLPKAMKAEISRELQNFQLNHLLANTPIEKCLTTLRGLSGILAFMNEEDQSAKLPKFVSETIKLDQLRGESVLQTFSELRCLFVASNVSQS